MLTRLRQAFRNAITIDGSETYRQREQYFDDDGFVPFSTLAGESRNPYGLAAVPAVYGAVNLLSDQISLLNPVVRVGKYDVRPNHPVSFLLSEQPSRLVNKVQFWRMMIRLYALHGNAFGYIRRDFTRRIVTEIIPAYCHRVHWVQNRSARVPTQRYSLQLLGRDAYGALNFNTHVDADARDVITYHGPGYNGLTSPSPVRYAAQSILTVMTKVLDHERQLLAFDDNSNLFIKTDTELGFEQYEKARDSIEEQVKGVREEGRIPQLPPGISLERFQMLTATDLRLIELLKWGVEDICRIWQVPPLRLAHYYQGMRVAGVENQAVDFERFSIQNRTGLFDAENTMKLLSREDKLAGFKVWTDTSPIGLGTLAERMDAAEQGVTRGGMWTIDEGRELTDKPPRPNGEGDRLLEPKGAPAQPGNPSRARRNREEELGPEEGEEGQQEGSS